MMWYRFIDSELKTYIYFISIVLIIYIISRSDIDENDIDEWRRRFGFEVIFGSFILSLTLIYVFNNSVRLSTIFKLMFHKYQQIYPNDMINMIKPKYVNSLYNTAHQQRLYLNSIDNFIDNHYDINIQNPSDGKTITHLCKDPGIFFDLLSTYKPDLNIQDHDGNTAIMSIQLQSEFIMFNEIKEAIKQGTNILIKNKNGHTLVDIIEQRTAKAFRYNHIYLNEFLISINNHEKQHYTLFEMVYYSFRDFLD